MKKLLIFLLLLIPLALFSQNLKSSFGEKLMPHFGAIYEQLHFQGPTPNAAIAETANNFHLWGINLGAYYVLAQSNDAFSIGLDFNIQGSMHSYFDEAPNGYPGDSYTVTSTLIQAPVFLMGRVGARCTQYNSDDFGFGVGLGMTYNQFKEKGFGLHRELDFSTSYMSPTFMVETSFLLGTFPLSLRFHRNLSPHTFDAPYIKNPTLQLSPIPKTWNNMGVNLSLWI